MASGIEVLADDLELVLIEKVGGRSTADLARTLRVREQRIEDAKTRLRARAAMFVGSYPLDVSGDVFVAKEGEGCAYRVLLALSKVSQGEIPKANEYLDEVVLQALRAFLGEGGQVINFAWPVAVSEDPRPADFPAAVRWLGDRMGLDVGTGYRSPARNDGGVDLVAVKRLAGSAKASPTYLVQTTLSTDVRRKARDIDLGLWRTWVDLGPATMPCLAVPHYLPIEQLDELHATGVLVLDRPRLLQLLTDPDARQFWSTGVGVSIQAWAERVLELRVAERWP